MIPIDWDLHFLEALRQSRPAYDEPPRWEAALALYDSLPPAEAAALDAAVLAMIDLDYRNPHAAVDAMPFDDVMVNLPQGITPEDLLTIEAAVLVAAERGLGDTWFRLNRLLRSPTWHPLQGRLHWLHREAMAAQRKLALTLAGRATGAMLGLAAGDALGCTVEFMARQELRRRYPDGHREILGGGPFGIPRGGWTDDTQMTVAVAGGIIARPDAPVPAVGERFIEWYRSGPPDVGNTCREAFEAFLRHGSWEAATAHVVGALGEMAGGNGALMRSLPAAIAYGPNLAPALAIARMTHPHPESDAAIALYQTMVDRLLQGASKEDAFAAGLAAAGPLADRLRGIAAHPDSAIAAGGYVVETIQAAIWSFLRSESLEETLVTAVNLGEDADTTGAVAGGLAGAHWGPLALPRRWTMLLQGRADLESLAEGLVQVRSRRNP